MPRSIQEILDHAEELAKRFEDYEPAEGDERSVEEHRLERAALARARSEQQLVDAVVAARTAGVAWQRIGGNLGPGGPAALRGARRTDLIRTAPSGNDPTHRTDNTQRGR